MFASSKVFCFVAFVAIFSTFALGLPSLAPPAMPSHLPHPPHPSLPTDVPAVAEEIQQIIDAIIHRASMPTGRPAPSSAPASPENN